MTNITTKSTDQINSEIDVKMDELFNLFWELTLNGIDNQKDYLLKIPNCPLEILDDILKNKSHLMKNRFDEIEDLLKYEFKNRFINEQWMDLNDTVPIIPTKLSFLENDYRDGFIITEFEIERNRRSFLKDFYFNQCGYTQIKTTYELFGIFLKWVVVYPVKEKFWDYPIRVMKTMAQRLLNYKKTKTL